MKNILIAPAHYRTYVSASRRLARRIGSAAPTAQELIQHELSSRNPRMIADEYLDHHRRKRLKPAPLTGRLGGCVIPKVDPYRN